MKSGKAGEGRGERTGSAGVKAVLYQNHHCPYSERARRVLAEKAMPHARIEIRWHEFEALRNKTGAAEVPALAAEGDIYVGSRVIADYAEAIHPERPLLPGELLRNIGQWEKEADRVLVLSQKLAVPILANRLEDSREREGYLKKMSRHGDYGALWRDRLAHWREVEQEWRKLNIALSRSDFLLEALTYADFALYGSVYLVAHNPGYEVPAHLPHLASWFERIRVAGQFREQELDLGEKQPQQARFIQDLYSDMRYSDPPAPRTDGRHG